MSPADYLPFGSKAKSYEQLPGYDLEALPLQDLPSASHSDPEEIDQNAEIRLVAGPYSPQTVSEPFDPEDFVPYKLTSTKPALFPEFYHHFKKSFSSISMENRAYCSKNSADFKASYIGTQQDIEASIIRVEHDFDSKFRQCLDPELLKGFESWIFTRFSVENTFVSALGVESDHISYSMRMKELTRSCKIDIDPLFEFLVAFDHSDESIWNHMIPVFSGHFSSGSRMKFMNQTAGTWKQENLPLKRQVQGFAKDMREKGFLSQGKLIFIFSMIALYVIGMIFFVAFLSSLDK